MEIERFGNHGIVSCNNVGVLTFEVQGLEDRSAILEERTKSLYKNYMNEYSGIRVGEFLVPAWGDLNNLYPQAVYSLISANKLIPQIIDKQVEYLYGKGPYLYQDKYDGVDIVRQPIEDDEVQEWLDSWPKYNLAPYQEYLLQIIQEYYHVPAIASKFIFSRARRVMGIIDARKYALPVIGLENVSLDSVRLATKNLNTNRRIKNSDCNYVVVGDWLNPSNQNFEFFDRFLPSDPFKFNTAISFNKNKTFTKDLYPVNRWFEGTYDWVKGANLTPKFINSYLKNALNARTHVLIPGAWVEKQANTLREICDKNSSGDGIIQAKYYDVLLVDPVTNEPLEYKEAMVEQLINNKLREITKMMSGEGKNQGKLWASIKYSNGSIIEEWDFKEIPSNYKEFIEALTTYDKRADQVILAGLGINSSISNVEKDGVISKSGSDVFYNYMIYINALTVPEYFVCQDINRALALNFPGKKVKIGLYHRTPPKTSEISPNNRMEEITE